MPRHPDILRPTRLETSLPEDLRARLDLHLYSELEGKVPKGAYQKLIIQLLSEALDQESLDLGDWCGMVPKGTYILRSSRANIEQLKLLLATE